MRLCSLLWIAIIFTVMITVIWSCFSVFGGQVLDSQPGSWEVVLGKPGFLDYLNQNIPAADTISSYSQYRGGVSIDTSVNPNRVYVADYQNSRVLGWADISTLANGQAADIVFGQGGDFTTSMYNKDGVSADSLYRPFSMDVDSSGRLYVCDHYNHRVFVYADPFNTDTTADFVFGQLGSFTTRSSNKGGRSATSLYYPSGIHVEGDSAVVFIADMYNHRVLEFTDPLNTDFTADLVYGQGGNFTTNGTYGGGGATTSNLRYPMNVSYDGTNLFIVDSGLGSTTLGNRVLVYTNALAESTAADFVFGQGDVFTTSNRDKGGVSASALDYPHDVIVSGANVYIADRSNYRILYYSDPLNTDRDADEVFGQLLFNGAGSNYLGLSFGMSYPAGIDVDGNGDLWYFDGGNNRVVQYFSPLTDKSPDLVLGQPTLEGYRNNKVSASSTNGPMAVTVDSSVFPNRLYIADSYNHRVLGFNDLSKLNSGEAADIVFGQSTFDGYMPNYPIRNANSLYYPRGAFVDSAGNLWVSDSYNHRVLCFITPYTTDTTADLVIGQLTYTTGTANLGGRSASSLYYPYGLYVDANGNLFVADYTNHRVLEYDDPLNTDAVADRVYGQGGNFTTNGTYGGGGATAINLNYPRGVFFDEDTNDLYIVDGGSGNSLGNRVLVYQNGLVETTTADFVFGQNDNFTTSTSDNGGIDAGSLDFPTDVWVIGTGAAKKVFICDNDNSRVLQYTDPLNTDRNADIVYGQTTFSASSSGVQTASGLLDPYGIAVSSMGEGDLIVADYGNHRVVINRSENIPVADAGVDQLVNEEALVTLDGSVSVDPDPAQPITDYLWTQTGSVPAGITITLSDAAIVNPTFTAPNYINSYSVTFELAVTAGGLNSDPNQDPNATVVINITADDDTPTADAGVDQNVNEAILVTLDGTASADIDVDGNIASYAWTLTGSTPGGITEPLNDPAAAMPTFTAPDRDGNYTLHFQLVVGDGTNFSTPNTIDVIVTAPNDVPVANAGSDQNINETDVVVLTGLSSSDADENNTLTYSWTQTTGPAVVLNNPSTSLPSFTAPNRNANYSLTFQLIVNDGNGDSVPNTVDVNVTAVNESPVADAGIDQSVVENAVVVLDGTGSNELDTNDVLNYQWTFIGSVPAGITPILDDGALAQPSFTALSSLVDYVLTFQLVVNDGVNFSAPNTVDVDVTVTNDPPVANAGVDQNVNEDVLVSLDGSASFDPDVEPITAYQWTQTGSVPPGITITLSSDTIVNPTFTAPSYTGNYTVTFELIVVAGSQLSNPLLDPNPTVDINVTADDDAPVASAGTDQNVSEDELVTLDGTGSADVDLDGALASYAWTQTGSIPAGITVTLDDDTSPTPAFTTADRNTNYTLIFELVVNDGTWDSPADGVNIIVAAPNDTPAADAGLDQTVPKEVLVTLDGTGSSDPDTNDSMNYQWTFLGSNPGGYAAILDDDTLPAPAFTTPPSLVNYDLTFQLIVNDGVNFSAPDTVVINVLAANQLPIAMAGVDQNVNEAALVTLDSTGSNDPDGLPITYLWILQSSNPAGIQVTLSDDTTAMPTFTAPDRQGNYTLTFQLVVNDAVLDSTPDTVDINVTAPNDVPIADAGVAQNAASGDIVVLDGSGSFDIDENDSLTYDWTQTGSNPPGIDVVLTDNTALQPAFIAPDYTENFTLTFMLIVNDGTANSTADEVIIAVFPINQTPLLHDGNAEHALPVLQQDTDGSGSIYLQFQIKDLEESDCSVVSGSFAYFNGSVWGPILDSDIVGDKSNLASASDMSSPVHTLIWDNSIEYFGQTELEDLQIRFKVNDGLNDSQFGISPTGFTVDNLPPEILTLYQFDVDSDGNIDEVVVEFDSLVQDDSISTANAAQFSIAGFGLVDVDNVTDPLQGSTASNSVDPGVQNDAIITLFTDDSSVVGTSAQPMSVLSQSNTFTDLFGNALSSAANILPTDQSPAVILSFEPEDLNGNGFLDRITFIFSENLSPGGIDINDWTIMDADGVTNLLQGLTNDDISLIGSVLIFYLADNRGSTGVPVYRYLDDGHNGSLADGHDNEIGLLTTNTPPVADAGNNITTPPDKVILDATASTDGNNHPLAYSWEQTGGPVAVTVSNAGSATPYFLGRKTGTYDFEVTVSDPFQDDSTDVVSVTVSNIPPTAKVGRMRAVQRDAVGDIDVTLSGVLSKDTNSVPGDSDISTYDWMQLKGPSPVVIVDNDIADPFAGFDSSVLATGVYVLKLTVTDISFATSTDTVTIIINDSFSNLVPNADAGIDFAARINRPVSLDGHESRDSDQEPLAFSWVQTSGPQSVALSNPSAANPSFTAGLAGIYEFALMVNDGTALSETDAVQVVIHDPSNYVPRADAGENQHVMVGDTVSLDGTGSVDTDQDHLTYQWAQIGGPQVKLSASTSAMPSFGAIAPALYEFQLIVNDGFADSDPDVTFVVIEDAGFHVPVANAGDDIIGQVGNQLTLNGSQSNHPDGSPITLQWSQARGPLVQLSGSADIFPTFTPTESGTYVFQLTVTDGTFESLPDDVVVVVNGQNNVPVASLENDEIQSKTGSLVELNGYPSYDPDGQDLLHFWTQVGGPPVLLDNHTRSAPSFTPPINGVYKFELYVDDGADRSPPIAAEIIVEDDDAEDSFGSGAVGGGGGGRGCFIATAAYGSYTEKHVMQLRKFRDRCLLTNAPGKWFVEKYYHYSPPMAAYISDKPILCSLARLSLLPLIALSWYLLTANIIIQLLVVWSVLMTFWKMTTLNRKKLKAT
ncbi:CFI-box-CTERM domain-containing protein [Planctomycetota bacterium]